MTVIISGYEDMNPCAVPLPLYARHLGMNECAFWGINTGATTGTCKTIWTLDNRQMVNFYLCQAQDEIENLLKYPLSPKWFTNEPHDMSGKKRCIQNQLTDWKKVISGGIRAESVIATGEAVDDATDPNIVGPVATTVTDPEEIHVFHEGSTQEIIPSKITIAGGNVTIEIPLCRFVLPAFANNPQTGWKVTDAVFATKVDIKRIYNDPSTQAKFINEHSCCSSCVSAGCVEYAEGGCILVRDSEIGLVRLSLAEYTDGVWSLQQAGCGCYHSVRLNYYAGLKTLSNELIDAIIRLAHSRMPISPCGCDPIKRFWESDRNIPQNITADRERCLFGVSDGAWAAWRIINNPGLRIFRAGVL